MQIEADRRRLSAEIRQYPSPIPACDAQFNYLLEEKNKTSGKLNLLQEIISIFHTSGAEDPALRALITDLGRIDAELAQRTASALQQPGAPNTEPAPRPDKK